MKKKCKKCGKLKLLTCFNRDGGLRSEMRFWCIECREEHKQLTRKKRCSKCGKWKDVDEFSKNSTKKDKLNCWCRRCISDCQRKHYQQNKEKYREVSRKWRNLNKERHKRATRECRKNQIKNLEDPYIKQTIKQNCDIAIDDIPRGLIELKKLQLTFMRIAKKGKDNNG